MMLRGERGSDRRPEPRGLLGGQPRVELPDNSERILVCLTLPAHAFEVLVDLVVACVVAHEAMLEFRRNVLKMSA